MKGKARILAFVLAMVLLPLPGRALEVAGKSAVLIDRNTGTVLYEHNAHEALAPASVTKIMTLLLIMEAIDSGKIGWQDMVTVSEAAAAKGGSQIYLKVGETMPVSDMVKSIAVSSANDCACAMAEHIAGSEEAFVEQMNRKAADLGMKDSHFVNCTGLDDDDTAKDHKLSAYDISLMSRELLQNHPGIKKYTTIWMDTVRNGTFGLSNTNKLIRFYSGATGLKTGFTSTAGYCLSATAQRDNLELIAVVMGAATAPERNAACKQLLDYGFANYAIVEPELTETLPIPVRLGKSPVVDVTMERQGGLLIDKGLKNQVLTKVSVETSVAAPVEKGQRLGTLYLMAGDETLAEIPLLAGQAVSRQTFWDLFGAVVKKLCMCADK